MGCYRACVRQCLEEIGTAMFEFYTNERITFFHDRGELFSAAYDAFIDVKENPDDRYSKCREYFVTFAPMGWENCTPLQPADMIAYDMFKLLDAQLHTSHESVRRSLQKLVGNEVPLVAGYTKMEELLTIYDEGRGDFPPRQA
jgi:hypothetical protein